MNMNYKDTTFFFLLSGLIEQYVDWNAIKAEFDNENFDLLAIPTNHFNMQEPGANNVILNGLEHVRPGNGFVANYRVAGKTEVNGANQEDLYTFLKVYYHCSRCTVNTSAKPARYPRWLCRRIDSLII